MTDVILGMGEVGQTLFDLLAERGFGCVGIDVDAQNAGIILAPTSKTQNTSMSVFQESWMNLILLRRTGLIRLKV